MPIVIQHQPEFSAAPISARTFDDAMARFNVADGAHIAVAVSGGADSMALALLASDWAKPRKIGVTALTVDHRLRSEAAAEARTVAAWMCARGIAHETLIWDAGAEVRHLTRSAQDAARDARYGLLSAWARASGCRTLLLAHHADDQIETFFLRLSRGSGLQGLASMDAQSVMRGVQVLRPLLDFKKSDLIATCEASGQAWVEDPSNSNTKYARSRFRQARAMLAAEGLTPDRLLATITHLQRARAAIQLFVEVTAEAACTWAATGVATVSAKRLFASPDEISLRVLSDVLRAAGGQVYGPRFERLERLHAKLMAGDLRPVTLHGCSITRMGDAITVLREAAAIVEECALKPSSVLLWDGRFEFVVGGVPAGLRLRPYQAADKVFWTQQDDSNAFDGIPATLRRTLPVVIDQKGPVAFPHLGLWRHDAAALCADIAVRFVGRDSANTLDI
ncbi:MAG: tRNA lysidine(34) synthetase TilS [Rhodospirillaceae bacterium]|nr:tRNA lysidine(34) synthetase TilS [Rhodospirillaceae bacterium]